MGIIFRAANTFAVFLFLANPAFALTVICPSVGSGFPVAGIPPGIGCAEIDKSFSAFADTVLFGSLGPGSQFSFSAGGTAPLGDTMFPVTAELNVLGVQQLTPSYQETIAYTVVSNTGGSYFGGSYPTPATPGATWAISGLTFMPNISINGNGQNAVASEQFCLNAASVTGCPSVNAGEIVVSFSSGGNSITCFGIYCVSGNGSAANFPTPVTQVAINFNVNVNGSSLLGVNLHNFDTEFSGVAVSPSAPEVPELSALLMAGVGLVCLVWQVRHHTLNNPFARAPRS